MKIRRISAIRGLCRTNKRNSSQMLTTDQMDLTDSRDGQSKRLQGTARQIEIDNARAPVPRFALDLLMEQEMRLTEMVSCAG